MNDVRPLPGYPGCTVTLDGTILLPDGTEAPLIEARNVHPKVVLPGPSGPIRVQVRRLVWVAWHGSDPGSSIVSHLNGNRFDNSVENLFLVPRKQRR